MRIWLSSVLIVLSTAVQAYASDASNLVARTISVYEQIEAIRTQMNEAVGGLSGEKRAYELALYELSNGPKTAEQLEELADGLKQQKKTLRRLRADGGSASSIAYCRRRIRDLSLMYKAGQAGTEAERQAFRDKAQPKIDELTQKIDSIEAPYRERIKTLESSVAEDNGPLGDLLREHILTPERAFPGSSINHLNANANMAFAACHWQDRDGEQIAWVHVRIRPLDEVEDYHREQLLDGVYPIQSLSDDSLWVWAGHFLVTFVTDDDSLKGKDTIQRAIHGFVDLDGLASIRAESGQVASGAAGD